MVREKVTVAGFDLTHSYTLPLGIFFFAMLLASGLRTRLGPYRYTAQQPDEVSPLAMTNNSDRLGAEVATGYDFGTWGSVMDVGGGNGMLLSHILRTHQNLRGVLADQPHVLERARQRGFLGGELAARTAMQECDFFREVPSGCRAYLMRSVIHDWNDERARQILINCRQVVPADGVFLLVEWGLSEANLPSWGKLMDLVMLVLTGGKERTIEEYRELLGGGGFRLQRVITTPGEVAIMEAVPD